jgi:hypothetical protein
VVSSPRAVNSFAKVCNIWSMYTTSTTVTLVSSGVSFLPGGVSISAVSAASVLIAVSFSQSQNAKLMCSSSVCAVQHLTFFVMLCGRYVWIDRDNRQGLAMYSFYNCLGVCIQNVVCA